MTGPPDGPPGDVAALADDAVARARHWIAATEGGQSEGERARSGQLASLVGDRAGLDLAVRFVDRVARPEDPTVAARELATMSSAAASGFLAGTDRVLLAVGAKVARLAPRV